MVLDTVLVGVTAEFLVDSINGLVQSHPSLSQEWVGLILLPIVSTTYHTSTSARTISRSSELIYCRSGMLRNILRLCLSLSRTSWIYPYPWR